jgi:glycosyltransferase involved in cell wall biosynthesis
MHKLCLIIPTKDRPVELERLLNSIKTQSVLPGQIIIVDGGEPGIKWLADKFSKLSIDYLQVLPPGLTRQRNSGLRIVRDDIDLVGFLDDDIVLEFGCIKNMLNFWESASDKIGGAGFNIIDVTPSQKPWWAELLSNRYLKNKRPGSLLKSGQNIPYCPASVTIETDWLCGGATVWKKEIFEKFGYDEWFATYGIVEDIDFSFRASKHYKLAVVADAKVRHIELPRKNHFLWAYVVTMNHLYLSKKHSEFSYPLCVLNFLADGLKCVFYGLLRFNGNYIKRGTGHLLASLKGSIISISRVERQVKGTSHR